jgi:Family of unknown function (DUF6172)
VRKTYRLQIEGKNRDRLVEASKHDVRRYVKRERSRPLPAGVDYWDFDCRFGLDESTAEPVHFANLDDCINTAVSEGQPQFYVELHTKAGHRLAKAASHL